MWCLKWEKKMDEISTSELNNASTQPVQEMPVTESGVETTPVKQKKHFFKKLYNLPYVGSLFYVLVMFGIAQGVIILLTLLFTITKVFPSENLYTFLFGLQIPVFLGILLLHKLFYRKEFTTAFNFKNVDWKSFIIIYLSVLVLNSAFIATGLLATGVNVTLSAFITALSAGVSEEILFREIPVSILMKNEKSSDKIFISCCVSAVMFSVYHAFNVLAGVTISYTISQMITTLGMGFMLSAFYVRSGNILFPIVFHFLHDFIALIQMQNTSADTDLVIANVDVGMTSFIVNGVISLIYIGVGVAVLLTTKKDNIKQLWNVIWKKQQVN